ncbi:hypothetical protein K1719_001832 [Acacia pycnantha]|nr:hypothetical protein K1719_001832 [Acacia pycnantha]
MYEAPRLQDRLSRTFIRTRTLINIQEPLVAGVWVPHPQRDSVWVTIRYERLQNYCYECGRIGHDAKNCIHQRSSMIGEEDEGRWGKWLGYGACQDIGRRAHDQTWDEVQLIPGNPKPTTGKDPYRRTIGGKDVTGNTTEQGGISATPR